MGDKISIKGEGNYVNTNILHVVASMVERTTTAANIRQMKVRRRIQPTRAAHVTMFSAPDEGAWWWWTCCLIARREAPLANWPSFAHKTRTSQAASGHGEDTQIPETILVYLARSSKKHKNLVGLFHKSCTNLRILLNFWMNPEMSLKKMTQNIRI